MPTGTCPECDADVHVDLDTDKGEIVSCEECGTDLEVVGLDPVELDIVEEETYDEKTTKTSTKDCTPASAIDRSLLACGAIF